MLSFILSFDPEVNTEEDQGNTPLHLFMKKEYMEYVKLLIKHEKTDIFAQNDKNENVFDLEKEGSDLLFRWDVMIFL